MEVKTNLIILPTDDGWIVWEEGIPFKVEHLDIQVGSKSGNYFGKPCLRAVGALTIENDCGVVK